MKTWKIALAGAVALALAADVVMAQPPGGQGQRRGGPPGFSGERQGPGRERGQGRPKFVTNDSQRPFQGAEGIAEMVSLLLNLQSADSFQFRLFAVGDVLLDGDEVSDLAAFVENRCYNRLISVQASFLSAIDDLALPDVSRGNGVPEIAVERLVMLAAL